MVHLREMPEHLRNALVNQEVPTFDSTPWVDAKPLRESRVALARSTGPSRHPGGLPPAGVAWVASSFPWAS